MFARSKAYTSFDANKVPDAAAKSKTHMRIIKIYFLTDEIRLLVCRFNYDSPFSRPVHRREMPIFRNHRAVPVLRK